MYIIGLNVYHGDASACLFKDGKLLFAAEEERFTRIKHAAGFPINAIRYCLENEKISLDDVGFITLNRNPKKRILDKLLYAIKNKLKIKNFYNRIKNFKNITSIEKQFEKYFQIKPNILKKKIIHFDHHLSHAASSVFPSEFSNSNFITIDGFGDFLSTTTGYFDGNNLKVFKEVKFPHSLGLFYTAITQYLGFKKYGDEYKVMGLAPYGKPIYKEKIKQIVNYKKNGLFKLNLDYFIHHSDGVEMSWLDGEPTIGNVYSKKLSTLLGDERLKEEELTQKHKDIAASTQKIYEEILLKILNDLHILSPSKNICLSGGCAMNSVANGKIIDNTPYEKVYINHAPGDSGGAIGSAILALKKLSKTLDTNSINNPYLGSSYKNSEIEKLLNEKNSIFLNKNIKVRFVENKDDLLRELAKKISNKKIVGFFNGKMEFGPRALGNRSILADPRSKNIREILNLKIKRRESFRPFAPSILKETVKDWFDIDDEVPFMSKVYQIKIEKRNLIPAVTHVDGTGRLQTVSKELNLNYYNLINYFNKLTGIPMLLNTSFNENEPIVCMPSEALACFLRTRMDILVLEDYLIERQD